MTPWAARRHCVRCGCNALPLETSDLEVVNWRPILRRAGARKQRMRHSGSAAPDGDSDRLGCASACAAGRQERRDLRTLKLMRFSGNSLGIVGSLSPSPAQRDDRLSQPAEWHWAGMRSAGAAAQTPEG